MTLTAKSLCLIIPSYESAKYLPDLFASIWGGESSLGLLPSQTLLPTEVILCDDCSTDGTYEVVQAYAIRHPELTYLRLSKNSGTSVACNEAIKLTDCEYITRIDADDMREPESFDKMYLAQIEHKHSVIYDDVRIFLRGSKQSNVWRMEEYDFDLLLEKNLFHAGIMFPKAAWEELNGYPEEFKGGRDDWAMNVALGSAGYCGVHVDYPGYLYRREQQNRTITTQSSEHQKMFYEMMRSRFSDLYAGRFPMACCGNRSSRVKATSSTVLTKSSTLVGGEVGMTLLKYEGGNYGTEVYYGPVTGIAYRFSKTSNIRNVDNRDLHFSRNQGLLDLSNNMKPVFSVYDPPAQEVSAPAVVPEPVSAVATFAEVEKSPAVSTVIVEGTPIIAGQVVGIGKASVVKLASNGIVNWETFILTDSSKLAEIISSTVEKIDQIKKDIQSD